MQRGRCRRRHSKGTSNLGRNKVFLAMVVDNLLKDTPVRDPFPRRRYPQPQAQGHRGAGGQGGIHAEDTKLCQTVHDDMF